MVLGKRKRRLYTKKYLEKAARRRSLATTKFVGPLRNNQKFTFKYASRFSIDPGVTGVPGVQVFSANGLYDPDITNIGHQPMGFDQIQAFYDHHVVIASKIKVWFSARNSNIYDQVISIHVADSLTAETDMTTILERPVCVNKMVGNGDNEPACLTLGVNPLKYLGKNGTDDNELEGSASANPSEGCFFHVSSAPLQGVNASALDCYAVIEYVAVMIEPKALTGS